MEVGTLLSRPMMMMSPSIFPRRFICLACSLWSALLPSLQAQTDSTLLTVGPGWAWVREFFPSSGETEIDQIIWTNPPPQIELDTLQVWNIRRLWPVRDWRWLEPKMSEPSQNALLWKPAGSFASPSSSRSLEIHLAEPLSHRLGHSITYRLPRWNWSAFYRVTVRGIGTESTDAVQVDLVAHVRIQNDTSAEYRQAKVSLVGTDSSSLAPSKPFGLLDLNPDSPLSDLWLSRHSSDPAIPIVYPLQIETPIPAHRQTEVPFAQVLRKPAQITHLCDSENIPAPTPAGGIPLQRRLLIANLPTLGLGFPLPAGKAEIFLGTVQGAPLQSGHVFPTPFPGTLQLDMGPVEAVRASRQTGEQQALPEGAWQAEYSITLVNQQKSVARIQVIEKPPTPMKWNLVKSSLPCQQREGTLNFDLTVQPQSTQTISYRLRLLSQSM